MGAHLQPTSQRSLRFVLAAVVLGSAATAHALERPVAVAAAPPAVSTGLPQVADLNGDGVPDLVVVNAASNSLDLYFGTGTFLPLAPDATLTGTPTNRLRSPRDIALGDFNGDGVTDIAVTNFRGASVSIFLGNQNAITHLGDGTFAGPTNIPVPRGPLGLAAGRFRGVGQPLDLAVVGHSNRKDGTVTVLLGNGDGTFTSAGDFAVGRKPKHIAVGDFGTMHGNGIRDGVLDVAVTVRGEQRVAVLFGDGTGNLSAPDLYSGSLGPDAIITGDFNDDGCSDLITTNHWAKDNVINMYLGICAVSPFGTFGGATEMARFSAHAKTAGVTAVDLNGDAYPDLAVTNPRDNQVFLLVNNGRLGPNLIIISYTKVACATAGRAPLGITAAHFNPNTDARDDLAVANSRSEDLLIFLGTGSTTLCPGPLEIGHP